MFPAKLRSADMDEDSAAAAGVPPPADEALFFAAVVAASVSILGISQIQTVAYSDTGYSDTV